MILKVTFYQIFKEKINLILQMFLLSIEQEKNQPNSLIRLE